MGGHRQTSDYHCKSSYKKMYMWSGAEFFLYIFLNSLHDKPDDTTPFLKTLALLLTVYFLLLDHIVPNF